MPDTYTEDPTIELSEKWMQKAEYYKYRSLYQFGANGEREPNPFTQSIFEKAEIWYSAPKDFNDPFDCNLKLHVDDSTDAEWGKYFDDVMPNPTSPDTIAMKAKKPWRLNPEMFGNVGERALKEHCEQSSVFCFSKKPNSIPMFSYYADSHQGIAIEFAFSQTEVPCGIPFGELEDRENWYQRKVLFQNVDYPMAYPELNFHRLYGTEKLILNTLFTKHHEWSHEEEFRVFRRGVPASTVEFDKTILTRVIFGCKTGQDEVDLVKGWLVGWPSDVILAKAKTASDKFELEIEDFETVKGTGTV